MRAALLQTLFAASFVVIGVAVQGATPEQAAKTDPAVTTIGGCLVKENPNARTGGGGASPNDYFVRTPTGALPVGATVAVGKPATVGTATSSGTPAGDSYYRITGMPADQLEPHLGHRVEIQGRVGAKKPDAAAGGITTTQTTVEASGKPKTTTETRVDVAGDLHATALKMVSASCK